MHEHRLTWLGVVTSIKSDDVKLVLWPQTFPLTGNDAVMQVLYLILE
jgi:hypothetical protein